VVYGRNVDAARQMGLFLNGLGLEPILFEDVRSKLGGTPTVDQIITTGMKKAHGVVAVFTGDEHATLRSELRYESDTPEDVVRWQARPNVIFEAGMAFGRARKRVVLVLFGGVSLFSDVAGIHVIRPTNDPDGHRATLRKILRDMKCKVTNSSEWKTK